MNTNRHESMNRKEGLNRDMLNLAQIFLSANLSSIRVNSCSFVVLQNKDLEL